MRFEILGSLRIVNGRSSVMIGAPKMETILAALLIRSDQVVSIDQLVTEVWGETPPHRATAALYVYISQLRKLLSPDSEKMIIETRAPGYVIRSADTDIDFHGFMRLVGDGRTHFRADRYDQAGRYFEQALQLWRGPALCDLREGPIINGFGSWVDEVRLETIEMLNETDLALGRHRELVSRLYALAREHPFHETFYRQLMLALYRSERRADALRVYQNARKVLHSELGIEPGPPLQRLQRDILDPSARVTAGIKAGV